jgi:hypothetical protein
VPDVTTNHPKQETTETYKATKDENQQKEKGSLKGGQKNVWGQKIRLV